MYLTERGNMLALPITLKETDGTEIFISVSIDEDFDIVFRNFFDIEFDFLTSNDLRIIADKLDYFKKLKNSKKLMEMNPTEIQNFINNNS